MQHGHTNCETATAAFGVWRVTWTYMGVDVVGLGPEIEFLGTRFVFSLVHEGVGTAQNAWCSLEQCRFCLDLTSFTFRLILL